MPISCQDERLGESGTCTVSVAEGTQKEEKAAMRNETIRVCFHWAKFVAKRLLMGAFLFVSLSKPVAGADSQVARNADEKSVTLDASSTILLGADEPPSLVEAAQDLAGDFEK